MPRSMYKFPLHCSHLIQPQSYTSENWASLHFYTSNRRFCSWQGSIAYWRLRSEFRRLASRSMNGELMNCFTHDNPVLPRGGRTGLSRVKRGTSNPSRNPCARNSFLTSPSFFEGGRSHLTHANRLHLWDAQRSMALFADQLRTASTRRDCARGADRRWQGERSNCLPRRRDRAETRGSQRAPES